MRNTSIVLTATILLFALAGASEQESAEDLKVILLVKIAASFGEIANEKLSESGVAQSDIDRISYDLSKTVAECMVESLIQQASEQGLDAEQLLVAAYSAVDSDSREGISDVLDEKELELKMEVCVLLAFENAGVRYP